MALSNAERQARHRQRVRERMPEQTEAGSGTGLTPEQIADRGAVIACTALPLSAGDRTRLPRFLGLDRDEWTRQPEQIAQIVGLGEAWTRWQDERPQRAMALTAAIRQRERAQRRPVGRPRKAEVAA
jgi:hypothetical protein